ncbi:MAG TPA: hypothetical protein VHS96_18940, partial [Bacteroidia bacterium]|nr:hypothetical protein [Bacteroidia bacterium]
MRIHHLVLVVAFLSGQVLYAQPQLDAILKAHAQAMGGAEQWQQLKSLRIVHMDPEGQRSTELLRQPDRYQLVFESPDGGQLIKSYDGKSGWISKNGNLLPMDPGEVIEMAEETDFHNELMMAKTNGHKLRLLPSRQLEGRDVFVIELEKNPSDIQTYFLDQETHLVAAVAEYSQDSKWKGTYFQTFLKDYKAVNGLQFPHRFGLQIGEKPPIWFSMLSIETNPVLLDEVFQKPSGELKDGRALIAAMHATAARASLREYTFVQETIRFDSLGQPMAPSIWYESLQYPDPFRIDVGNPADGRAVIYRNDSSYYFRDGKLARATADPMEFLFLEGALKCYPLEAVIEKVGKMGYDLGKFHVAEFNGKAMYVLGAEKGDLKSKQVWVEQQRLIPVRRI